LVEHTFVRSFAASMKWFALR